jgi:hypothetical protein
LRLRRGRRDGTPWQIFNGDIEHNSIVFNQSDPTVPTDGGLTPTFGEFFRRATSTSSEPTN